MNYDKYKGHTKGPWYETGFIDDKCHLDIYQNGSDLLICSTPHDYDVVKLPNARLIADAPLILQRCMELEEALTNLRQAQKNYIAWTRQAQHEPDYAEERERLGKLVGEAAEVADQVLSREVREVNDE